MSEGPLVPVSVGGVGGGTVVEGVWLHDELRKLGLEPAVLDVIANRRERIGER